jgi:hypothetical protein
MSMALFFKGRMLKGIFVAACFFRRCGASYLTRRSS